MKRKVFISLMLLLSLLLVPSFAQAPFSTGFLEEAELSGGVLENLEWKDGALTLVEGAEEGVFTSQEMDVFPFEYAILSWNALTPRETSLEVEARFFHAQANEWSPWMSWGIWKKSPTRQSFSESHDLSAIDYDIAWVTGDNTRATKIQIRATLSGQGVRLRRIAYTLRDTTMEERKVSTEHQGFSELPEIAISQQIREPSIAPVMCSAVTVSTQLEILGDEWMAEEVALNQYDGHLKGFGNWSFSASGAGELGFKSYVTYADEEELLTLLDKGYPLGMSVKYSNVEGGSYPYIEGAPLTTPGHLIAIRGYELEGDEIYYLVSDPAAATDEKALLRYKGSQLMEAWTSRILYVVQEKELNESSLERVEVEFFEGEEEGIFHLQEDLPLPLGKNLRTDALRKPEGGYLAYTLEGDPKVYYNLQMVEENTFRFMGEVEVEKATVYLMRSDGLTYVAKLSQNNASLSSATMWMVGVLVVVVFVVLLYRFTAKKKIQE